MFPQELKCPLCSLTELQIGGGMVSCLTCGYKSESNRYLNLLSIQNYSRPCPHCTTRALVDLEKTGLYKQQGPLFICFSCGKSWLPEEMDYCPECGDPQPREGFQELIICRSSVGFYVCRSCYNKTCSPE